MKRRNFFKFTGLAGLTLAGKSASAQEREPKKEFVGVLVDTTRCIGCRACEVACSESNNLPVPDIKNDGALAAERTTSETQWMVVNRYETEKGNSLRYDSTCGDLSVYAERTAL